ncbi:MAG: fibronectin type III domain-containing protein, partial [Muribaculaceae bacterium]|nr:fibronectin type III domain-containing protein [Muribaculaceae bacterium]
NPYTLEGLLPNTEYELGIQSIKDEDVSDWSNIIHFTTGQSGVAGVAADKKADNVWYNLLGVRLNGQPTQAGIYINNGKKVIIK